MRKNIGLLMAAVMVISAPGLLVSAEDDAQKAAALQEEAPAGLQERQETVPEVGLAQAEEIAGAILDETDTAVEAEETDISEAVLDSSDEQAEPEDELLPEELPESVEGPQEEEDMTSETAEEDLLDLLTDGEITFPGIVTVPTASDITYGQTLTDSVLEGGEADVPGTFTWKDETIAPAVSDSETTEYDVIFTPENQESYSEVTIPVRLVINKADAVVIIAPVANTDTESIDLE